jgi:hypothetical protein
LPEPTPIEHHAIWLEAHYAMGKIEVQQGFIFDWRERSSFIKNYIADRTRSFGQVEQSADEIESDKANN